MENVRFETLENINETTTEIAIIEHADGSFTTMLKSDYDAKQLASLEATEPEAE